jgi:Leucine-rich repeat (LRR) protein
MDGELACQLVPILIHEIERLKAVLNERGPTNPLQGELNEEEEEEEEEEREEEEETHEQEQGGSVAGSVPSWSIIPWLTSIRFVDILASEILRKKPRGQSQAQFVRQMSADYLKSSLDNANVALKRCLLRGQRKLHEQEYMDAKELHGKFSAAPDSFTFTYGGMDVYHAGLEGLIGPPTPDIEKKMKWEHTESWYASTPFACWYLLEATTAREEYAYVNRPALETMTVGNGLRDEGHPSWTLQHFMEANSTLITRAGLVVAEVMALRLYTGPMYLWYNNVLRYCKSETAPAWLSHMMIWKQQHPKAESPFTTTLHVLNSAILKLAKVQPAERVFRGSQGGVLPPKFWAPNEYNIRGGIELGFMSTTRDRSVAVKYSTEKDNTPSMLFEIQMGMVDRGSSIQWCSQFPKEEEILFAPLTGLEVLGSPRVEGRSLVVELRLNCNLHDLTIEQVTAKMKKTHMDLVHTIKQDMLMLGFKQDALQPLLKHEAVCSGRRGEWFISAENYKAATFEALQAKLVVCAQVLETRAHLKKSDDQKQLAAELLLATQAHDDEALAIGIRTIISSPALLLQYGPELERIAEMNHLSRLDLRGLVLHAPIPEALLKLMGSAVFFDFSGSSFGDVRVGTVLHEMVFKLHNWKDVTELNWSFSNPQLRPHITELPECAGMLRSLTQLDLSRNKIEALPTSLALLPLHTLDLSYNYSLAHTDAHSSTGTGSVEWVCANIPSLKALLLDGLQLHKLPATLTLLTSLRALRLAHNPNLNAGSDDSNSGDSSNEAMRQVCSSQSWAAAPLLRDLKLHNTGLSKVPDSIAGCTSLTVLDLSDQSRQAKTGETINCLCALPEAVGALQSLQRLYLQSNGFTIFPAVLCELPTLQVLNVANNEISALPEAIVGMQALRVLNVHRNKLDRFPISLVDMPSLATLNRQEVRSGRMLTFESSGLKSVSALLDFVAKYNTEVTEVNLRGNAVEDQADAQAAMSVKLPDCNLIWE